jgi:hypothetical protein
VPSLIVTLTNTSGAPWRSERGDCGQAVAWILDGEGGQPLPAKDWFVYASGGVTDLAAGESIDLAVVVATQNVDELPCGEFGLTAVLMGIRLTSGRGRLHLI